MKVHCYIVVRFEGDTMKEIVMVYREYDKAKVFCDALNERARHYNEDFPLPLVNNAPFGYRVLDREIV